MRVVYICDYDDKQFENEEECISYERNFEEIITSVEFWYGRNKIKEYDVSEWEKHYNYATKMAFRDIDTLKLCSDYFGICIDDKNGNHIHKITENTPLVYVGNKKTMTWTAAE